MQKTGDFRDIDTDFRTGMPEVRIYPDRELATESGVTVDTIADTGSVLELRRDFGPGMVTALGRVQGRPVGIVMPPALDPGAAT